MARVSRAALANLFATMIPSGRLTTKGSCARNLHRLNAVILFTKLVFANLLKDPKVQLKDAIYSAYEGSLAPIHT